MDEDEMGSLIDAPPEHRCWGCSAVHICKRCVNNMHICTKCGKISHECEICGCILDSLTGLRKHKKESKICKKARVLTAKEFHEQLDKFVKKHVTPKKSSLGRRKSLPNIYYENVPVKS